MLATNALPHFGLGTFLLRLSLLPLLPRSICSHGHNPFPHSAAPAFVGKRGSSGRGNSPRHHPPCSPNYHCWCLRPDSTHNAAHNCGGEWSGAGGETAHPKAPFALARLWHAERAIYIWPGCSPSASALRRYGPFNAQPALLQMLPVIVFCTLCSCLVACAPMGWRHVPC